MNYKWRIACGVLVAVIGVGLIVGAIALRSDSSSATPAAPQETAATVTQGDDSASNLDSTADPVASYTIATSIHTIPPGTERPEELRQRIREFAATWYTVDTSSMTLPSGDDPFMVAASIRQQMADAQALKVQEDLKGYITPAVEGQLLGKLPPVFEFADSDINKFVKAHKVLQATGDVDAMEAWPDKQKPNRFTIRNLPIFFSVDGKAYPELNSMSYSEWELLPTGWTMVSFLY